MKLGVVISEPSPEKVSVLGCSVLGVSAGVSISGAAVGGRVWMCGCRGESESGLFSSFSELDVPIAESGRVIRREGRGHEEEEVVEEEDVFVGCWLRLHV